MGNASRSTSADCAISRSSIGRTAYDMVSGFGDCLLTLNGTASGVSVNFSTPFRDTIGRKSTRLVFAGAGA